MPNTNEKKKFLYGECDFTRRLEIGSSVAESYLSLGRIKSIMICDYSRRLAKSEPSTEGSAGGTRVDNFHIPTKFHVHFFN